MTSSPLFISVAESIVILRPICHVGWRSASPGVDARQRLGGRWSRNGPPDAVRIRRRTSSRRAPVQALVDGVVLAVDRQDRHAAAPRRGRHERAGHHQHFLVGQRDASCRPRWPRGRPRAPPCPTRRRARCPRRGGWRRRPARRAPGADGHAEPRRARARPVPRDRRGRAAGHRHGRGTRATWSAQTPRRCSPAASADDLRARSGCASTTASALCADRAGRAEDGDARFMADGRAGNSVVDGRGEQQRVDRGRACRRARESAPSCPSRRRSRLSSDSNRSPAIPSAATATPEHEPGPVGIAGQPPAAQRGHARAAPTTRPPTAPSTVFFGLIAGASGARPNARPA